jgi:hypothetical protein
MSQRAPKMRPDQLIIANLSGRGDKDVAQAAEFCSKGRSRRSRGTCKAVKIANEDAGARLIAAAA